MANIVLLPQIGVSEESAVLASWYVKKGDSVKVGDRLFSLETGKAAYDVESEYAGTVLALLCEEGEEKPIKAPLCAIGAPGEEFAADTSVPAAPAAPEQAAANIVQTETTQTAATAPPVAQKVEGAGVSPRARALADKAGVDPSQAAPTGPEGRVIERDVRALIAGGGGQKPAAKPQADAAAATAAPAAAYEDKPLSGIRKVIAANMHRSLAESAQLTHSSSFDATAIQSLRKKLKDNPETTGISLGDMVLFAVTRTLPDFPEVNTWFMGDKMRYFADVNLAVAVDTDRGLMVPVIREANKKTLLEISNECKALADACRKGGIAPDRLTGGSFTVSNLGILGIESFTPVLNPPQTAILGVCNIALKPRRAKDGSVEFYDAMSLSLTYDHRAFDGAPASRFLQALCKNLENFTLLLVR